MIITTGTTPAKRHRPGGRDDGYSFAELLVTVVFIGVLATFVTGGVRDVTAEAAVVGCDTDGHQVSMAITSYLLQQSTGAIPASGDDPDRYERTLVDAGYLKAPSVFHDVSADGTLTPQEDSPC